MSPPTKFVTMLRILHIGEPLDVGISGLATNNVSPEYNNSSLSDLILTHKRAKWWPNFIR